MCWVNTHSIARITTTYRVIKVWQQEWTSASVAPRSKHNSVLVVLARCRVLSKINVHGNAWLISCSFHMLHGVVQESLKCCSDYFFLAMIPGTFPSLNAIPSLCVVCKNTIVLLRPLPGKGVLIILVRLLWNISVFRNKNSIACTLG